MSAQDRIVALAREGRPPREMVNITGLSVHTINWHLANARKEGEVLPKFTKGGRPKGLHLVLPNAVRTALLADAKARRMTPSELAVAIVEACTRRGMVEDVLDEAEATDA